MNLEALLETFLANLPFIVIVIGGIISFLRRIYQNDSAEQKKKEIKKTIAQENSTPVKEEKNNPIMGNIDSERTELSQMKSTNTDQKYKEKAKEKLNPNNKKISKSVYMEKNMNRKNVIQGIVWSEILGEPRSKKPHPITKKY